MRALHYEGPGAVAWKETPAPQLGDEGALVRPLAVASCDADRAAVHGQLPLPGPYMLGHEFVAEVLEVSADPIVEPGAIVTVPFQISCGICGRCRVGRTGNCESVPPLSTFGFGQLGGPWGGSFADVVHVPYAEAMLVALPDTLDAAAGANAADNLADTWRTVGPPLRDRPGASVLVVGGGAVSIGLWAADLAGPWGRRS